MLEQVDINHVTIDECRNGTSCCRLTAEEIRLSSAVRIVCVANSFRSIRGPTFACAIFDEVAFWRSDNSANQRGLRAVRPAMLTAAGNIA